jgi:glycosyltransferase involved in cell wall biosynthesis
MLGTSHSWAVTIRSLIAELVKKQHKLNLNTINNWDLMPKEYVNLSQFSNAADIDLTYTLPRNFGDRFEKTSKLKLAIYNYESSKLPVEWVDKINLVDYALPSSNYSKEIFVQNGWPESKCVVVPHGINLDRFKNKSIVDNISTKKKFKFLNISIAHYRKNIDLVVDAYYSAFTDKDDVCLILKTDLTKPKNKFECDVLALIKQVQQKHNRRNLPQIEILAHRYDDIVPLINTCDVLVSASSAEGFGIPLLEGLAAGKIVIAPKCSGQMDFLSDENSLLVEVQQVAATEKYQYWRPTPGAKIFMPIKEALTFQMKNAYENYNNLIIERSKCMQDTCEKFTWSSAADKILEIK